MDTCYVIRIQILETEVFHLNNIAQNRFDLELN